MPVVSWIGKNKLSTILLIIIIVFFGVSFTKSSSVENRLSAKPMYQTSRSISKMSEGMTLPSPDGGIIPEQEYAPEPNVSNRMVIENSSVSLLVKNVREVKDAIITYAQQHGGYMVNSEVVNPYDTPSATITIRVKSTGFKDALAYITSLSLKVVSENLQGTDVTDQYMDIAKRISILENTIAKFESILASAKEISDITNLTRQIINYQTQIDNLKGSQQALEKNAELAKITIYLSTDEIALPYTPNELFRPGVIFKLAVRSLVGTLRTCASVAIWVGVYAVVWVPVLLIFWFIKKYISQKQRNTK